MYALFSHFASMKFLAFENLNELMDHMAFQYESDRKSIEFFHPGPDSESRTATAKSSVFNLVSTIIGGGVLSLSFAFDKCGLVFATILMLVASIASDFILYVLVSCSRRSGAQSYEEIAAKAFGKTAQLITMALLIMLTFLVFVGYVILARDLASPLVERYLLDRIMEETERNLTAVGCVVLVSPVLFFRSINALRFTSIFSLLSILVLVLAIGIRSVQSTETPEFSPSNMKFLPTSWHDVVYAFPIISVSFLCHFNVLPVYGELHQPTRRRLKTIVHVTMASTWVFYIILGGLGYVFAFQSPQGVQDNILNNFSNNDDLINAGRLGLVITVLLSLPLLVLPCRATLYRLLLEIQQLRGNPSSNENMRLLDDEPVVLNQESPLLMHCALTITIIVCAVFMAFSVPGVSVVWSVMGSTVGILIAYVIPSMSYIRIRHEKPNTDDRKRAAWVLFVFGSIAMVVCSIQAAWSLAI